MLIFDFFFFFRENYLRELREWERKEDEKYLQHLSLDDFSSVRRVHITEKDVVVEMLRIVYMDHPRVGFLVVKGREEETKRNMEWFWGGDVWLDFFFRLFILF